MQKTMTYMVLILLIGGGFLAGSFIGGSLVGGLVAPSDHKAIAEDFQIYDDYYDNYLPKPTLVTFGTLKYGEKLSSLSVFIIDQPYQYSLWIWQRKGDTEMTMEIWGPDPNGNYDVGFGRTGLYYGGHIEYQGAEVLAIQNAFSASPNGEGFSTEGEYALTVTR